MERMQDVEDVDIAKRRVTLHGPEGPSTWNYDLMVGAEGAKSVVRKVLVKSDKQMKSEFSFVGPMRYVTAFPLPAEPDDMSSEFARLISPPSQESGAQDSGTAQSLGFAGMWPTVSVQWSNVSRAFDLRLTGCAAAAVKKMSCATRECAV
jgi:hypothetical protein